MQGDARLDPEVLLEHREFVRALAARLLADEHKADDIVQETWLAALKGAPSRPRSMRAWLARVARNLALKMARTDARRARRERLHEPVDRENEPIPDAVERLARERRVVDAVLELEEPYRTIIVLRFYEDLTPSEIAGRCDQNAATVRTRLKRGLDMLRGRLDREFGGRRSWCLALIPLLVPQAKATAAVAAPGGVLLMSAKAKSIVAVVLLLAATVGVFALWTAQDSHRESERAAGPDSTAVPARIGGNVHEVEAPGGEAENTVSLVVRVEDLNGNPIPEARVAAHASIFPEMGMSYSSVDAVYERGRPSAPAISMRTDSTGTAAFQHEPRTTFVYVATKGGYSTGASAHVEIRSEVAPSPVTIRLGPAHTLAGHVLDEDGRPIVGALVLAADPEYGRSFPDHDVPRRATSGADGSYRFDDLPRSDVAVWATWPGGVPFRIATLRFPYVDEFDIVLERGGIVIGRVADADTNLPIANARVRVNGYAQHRAETFTDAQGHYHVDSLPATMLNSVLVQREGWYQLFRPEEPDHIGMRLSRGDTMRVDVAMRRAPVLCGTVRGPDGPLANAVVRVSNFWTLRGGGWFHARTDDHGQYEVALRPGRFQVRISAPGFRLPGAVDVSRAEDAEVDAPNLMDVPERGELVRDFVMETVDSQIVEVRGRVVDDAGQPVAGARVVGTEFTSSASDGAFKVRARFDGTVWALKPDFVNGKAEVDGAGTNVLIALAKAPRLFGAVRRRGGGPLEDAFVLIGRRGDRGWLIVEYVPAGPDGRYERVDPPGRYLVRAGATGSALSLPQEIELEEGTDREVNIELDAGNALRGRVASVEDGVPITGAWVHVTPLDRERRRAFELFHVGGAKDEKTVFAVTGLDGEFKVESLAAGEYDVLATARGFMDGKAIGAAGGRRAMIELEPSLEIRGVAVFRDDRPAAGVRVFAEKVDEERKRYYSPGTGLDGRFAVSGLPAGVYRVVVGGRGARSTTSAPVEAGSTGLRLVLERAAPGEEREWPQTAEGGETLEGRIVDPSGKGIGDVRVYASKMSNHPDLLGKSTRSRADGGFTIRGLAAEPYRVRAWFEKGMRQVQSGVVPGREPVTFVFTSLSGVVLGDDVADRTIRARPLPYDKDEWGATGVVGEGGRFEIRGLSPGRYELSLEVEKEHPQLLLEGAENTAAGRHDLVLKASRGAVVAGIVVGEDGEPLAGVYVMAVRDGRHSEAWMKTGADGQFELSGLVRGFVYEVAVRSEGRMPAEKRIEAPASAVRFVVKTGLQVTGRLLNVKGGPCAEARLRFVPANAGAHTPYVRTDVEGRFTVAGLGDGEYLVEGHPKAVRRVGDPEPEWQTIGRVRAGDRDVVLTAPEAWR